jgi:ABC-2 type transport system permease protein
LAILSIARLTYLEALRQPLGLVLAFVLATLALFSPSFTSFTLGKGVDLLRSNLLSTLMLGGVIFASLLSNELIQKDLQRKTLLTILSRPVNIPSYYLGKWLGIAALLSHFWIVMVGVSWTAMVIGTPDSASTDHNFIALTTLGIGLVIIVILSLLLNYAFNLHIISFIFSGWALWTPVTILVTMVLSPPLHLPLPSLHGTFQFLLAAFLVGALIQIVASFAMALSTVTTAVANMILCLLFLFIGLMGPGLESLAGQVHPWLQMASRVLPDFHLLWTADWLSMEHTIPLDHLVHSFLYSLSLMASFSFLGVYAMMRKDLS